MHHTGSTVLRTRSAGLCKARSGSADGCRLADRLKLNRVHSNFTAMQPDIGTFVRRCSCVVGHRQTDPHRDPANHTPCRHLHVPFETSRDAFWFVADHSSMRRDEELIICSCLGAVASAPRAVVCRTVFGRPVIRLHRTPRCRQRRSTHLCHTLQLEPQHVSWRSLQPNMTSGCRIVVVGEADPEEVMSTPVLMCMTEDKKREACRTRRRAFPYQFIHLQMEASLCILAKPRHCSA